MSGDETGPRRLTYADYLRLNDLLNLQEGEKGNQRTISNDEFHFIIVHQSFELWFSLIIRELRETRDLLLQEVVPEESIPKAVHHLDRVTEIFRLLAGQWKVMETLTPQDFLAFRDELGTASGFESFQMRELEIILGLTHEHREGGMDPIEHFRKLADEAPSGNLGWERVVAAVNEISLADTVTKWLHRTPIQGSIIENEGDSLIVRNFVEEYLNKMQKIAEESLKTHKHIGTVDYEKIKTRMNSSLNSAREFLIVNDSVIRHRAGLLFIESYRELPLLAWPRKLIDALVEMESAMVLFRTHHARMVERMIGRRVGTGGSSGVDYLDATTKYRVFKDLWGVRTLLMKSDELPILSDSEFYGFNQK